MLAPILSVVNNHDDWSSFSEIKNKTADVEKSEKEVEDKENAKNAANHDESVWGGASAAKEELAPLEDPAKPKWDDPTNVDWGDEAAPKAATAAAAAPVVPPPPTQATIDAWGDTGPPPAASDTAVANDTWGANDGPAAAPAESWADSGPASDIGKEEGATKYRALFEFEARNEDELSFQPGDIIKVTVGEQGEPGWLAGELRGKSGWFPESYVEPLDGGQAAANWDSAPAEAEVRSTPLDTVQEEPGTGEGESIYYALYQYDSTEAGDLCFPTGAAIKVTQKNGDWWTGSYNGVSGIFPGNYVSAEKPVVAESEVVTAGAGASVAQASTDEGRQPENANGRRLVY